MTANVLEVLKNHDLILRRDPTHVDYKPMAEMKRLLSAAGFTIERSMEISQNTFPSQIIKAKKS